MALLYAQLRVVEALEAEEEDAGRGQRVNRRRIRDMQDPLTITDVEFVSTFRLNKDACKYIIDTISPNMYNGIRVTKIPPHLRILTALHFVAFGSYQRSIGNNFLACVSQPVVSRCLKEVTNLLIRHCLHLWIKYPKNEEQRNVAKNKFNMMHGHNEIIGIIDDTHIAIVKPLEENEHVFVNRKGYHSLNVQIICDANLCISNCLSRFPGSIHDSHIWRNSAVGRIMRANFENGDIHTKILGDSGYAQNDQEIRYNTTIKRVRSSVERCIGVLKARFRCLLKDRTLHYSPTKASKIVMACAILHNIARYYNVDDPEPILDEIDAELPVPHPMQENWAYREAGQNARRDYVTQYFKKIKQYLNDIHFILYYLHIALPELWLFFPKLCSYLLFLPKFAHSVLQFWQLDY